MTIQPTPGPWSVYNEDGVLYIRYEVGPRHGYLAKVFEPANARLIAAAPRILEMLKVFAAQCKFGTEARTGKPCIHERARALLRDLHGEGPR